MSEHLMGIGSVPPAPPSGYITLYPKIDGRVYSKDSAGNESPLTAPATTDNLGEGSVNKYFTNERAQDAIALSLTDTGTIKFSYNDAGNEISAIIATDSITDSQINAAANILLSKLASLTANRATVTDGAGKITASTTTATEIGHVAGVTSSIQAQLDSKQSSGVAITALTGDVTGTGPGSVVTTIANSAVSDAKIAALAGISLSKLAASTANKALVTDASGFISPSSVSSSEIGYLSGVTSGIQSQIDGKQQVDSDLTAIAGLSSTGIISRTGAGSASTRSIQGGTGISVSNGSGVSGDPSVSLANTSVTPAIYGSTTQVPVLTIDQQGRITTASNTAISAASIILTPNKAVISGPTGSLGTNAVSSTELGYLSGVTSAIQTQFSGKFAVPTGSTSEYIRGDGSVATFPTFSQADRLVTTVKNQTGSTIPAGAVVYINGSSGNDPTITPALADSDINSAKTYGLTTAAIPDNTLGSVVASGRLQNINTSAFLAGATLYLSPTVAGGYTTTKPTAPNHLVAIGFVIRSHPTQGEIEVKVINGFELNELHDVAISASPVTGQSIYYDSVTDLWTNQTPPMSINGQMAVSFETAVIALTDAATIAVNASLGNTFTVTLGGNRTLGTPSNPTSGQKIIVRVTQDGTGGRTLSYSSGWNLGADFTGLGLSTTAGATDYIGAIYNGITSKWDVVSIMRGY
jgi:hypothetical protein